jgi:hypothetical protein
MSIVTLNNRAINRSDTASSGQAWVATSATASDFQVAGGVNTPCFFASYTGSGVEISDATWTKGEFTTEVFDVGSCYSTTDKRWTPGFAGKSFLSMGLWFYDASTDIQKTQIAFYKNGSTLGILESAFPTDVQRHWMTANMIVSHDDDDYFEAYIKSNTSNSGNIEAPSTSVSATNWRNYFQGFKIIE